MKENTSNNLISGLKDLGINIYDVSYPLYHYTSVKAAKAILLGQSLWYRSTKYSNDPFELNSNLIDHTVDSLDSMKEIYSQVLEDQAFDSQKVARLVNSLTKESFYNNRKAAYEGYRKRMGIFCFSKIMDNTLMWSHYSDKHRGVCLGFRLRWDRAFITMSVNYMENLIPIKAFKNNIRNPLTDYYWIFTKSNNWAYEQEVRRFNISSSGKFPFEQGEFREIYYGAATSQKDIAELEKIIDQKSYKIYNKGQMEIDPGTFRLKNRHF